MLGVLQSQKIKIAFILTLAFAVAIAFTFGTQVQADDTDLQKEKAEQLANAIYQSSIYDEVTKSFTFDEQKAITLGLDELTASQMNTYLESLTPEEAEITYNEMENPDTIADPNVFPVIIVWAARTLAAAGLGWLAKKLLDWGATKFCNAYEDYNRVTGYVCDVIG
jgi:hypothetical protein